MPSYTFTCIRCGRIESLTESEIQRFERKGLHLPKRCYNCREERKKQRITYEGEILEDEWLVCYTCGQQFKFERGEQLFYSERSLNKPKNCPLHRGQHERYRETSKYQSTSSYLEDNDSFSSIGQSTSYSQPNSGCFIATAAFNSPMNPKLKVLRKFRDNILMNNKLGYRLIIIYYKTSPPIAKLISRSPCAKKTVRTVLNPIIKYLEARSSYSKI